MGVRGFTMKKVFALLSFIFFCLIIYFLHITFKKKDTINTRQLLAAGIDLLEEAGKRIVEIRRSPYMSIQNKVVKNKDISTELLTNADITSHRVIKYGLTSMFPGLKVISEERADEDETMVYLPNLDRIKLPKLDGGEEVHTSDISVWIDPLDATQEFSENLTEYVTIMMCIVRRKDPIMGIIYKPFQKMLYWAYHSYDLSYISWEQKDFSARSLTQKPRIIVSRSHAGNVKDTIQKAFRDKFDVIPAGGSGFKTIEIIEGRADVYLHKTIIKKWDTCAPDALLQVSGLRMTDLRGLPIEYDNSEDLLNVHGLLASRGTISGNYDHYEFLKALRTKT